MVFRAMTRDAGLHLAHLLAPKPMARPTELAGRHVIVTGASNGSLGYVIAHQLASWGAQVVATCLRDPDSLQQALRAELDADAAGGLTVRALDLSDRGSVTAFADWHRERFGARLHVLINNAGILRDLLPRRREAERSPDGFEIHWRTNYLGTFHLTSLLLPMLIECAQAGGDARVLNVTSHQHMRGRNDRLFAGVGGDNAWNAYGQSKLALIHMALELNRRHGGTGNFRAVALHPGSVYTNLVAGGLRSYVRLNAIRPLLAKLARTVLLTPMQGAQTALFCATDDGLEGGRYYERCALSRPSTDALDAAAAERLWDASADWLAHPSAPPPAWRCGP